MEKYLEERPWGKFEQFTHNEKSTVKLLYLSPNQALSLQYHHNRDEFWHVIDGEGIFQVGDKVKTGRKGDEFFIKKEAPHRISTKDSPVTVLEISLGTFDEKDEVRVEDIYNRK